MEKTLLDLTLEYAAAKDCDGSVEPFGTARTPDEIATEYGQALRKFLA